jgi:hypothetical protein
MHPINQILVSILIRIAQQWAEAVRFNWNSWCAFWLVLLARDSVEAADAAHKTLEVIRIDAAARDGYDAAIIATVDAAARAMNGR